MEEERDFQVILDELFRKRSPDERIDTLVTAMQRQRDRFNEKLAEERNNRRKLVKRVQRQERLTNHILQVLLFAGAYFAAVSLARGWKKGDWWSILTVLACAAIVYLPLREILRRKEV